VKPLAAVFAVLVTAACGGSAAKPPPLVATAVPLNTVDPAQTRVGALSYVGGDPAQTRVGALSYVGGLHLTAPGTSLFGGLSGLETREVEGLSALELTAVSDQGDRFAFTVDAENGLRLSPGGDLHVTRLTQDGAPLGSKAEADAEGLTLLDADAEAVSFERRPRVRRYAGRIDSPLAAPVVDLPENEGFEGLAHLPLSGRKVLAVGAEDGRIWFCDIAPGGACTLFLSATPAPGFKLTGLDHLPGTADMVAIYRAYDPVFGSRAIIAWISTGVTAGSGPQIVPLARLARPLTVDNMEGIAAVALPGRGWRLFVVSDDNFSTKQRTLLLAFDWLPERAL
jgi:hypothetical protein